MNTEFQERIITKIRREFGDEIINILNDDKTIELMLNSDDDILPTHKCGGF
nr:hypothetical protein [Campylobacter fetus]